MPKFGEKKSDCQVPTKQNWKHKIFLKSNIWQRAAISVLKNFVGNFYIRTHQKFPILHPVIYIKWEQECFIDMFILAVSQAVWILNNSIKFCTSPEYTKITNNTCVVEQIFSEITRPTWITFNDKNSLVILLKRQLSPNFIF